MQSHARELRARARCQARTTAKCLVLKCEHNLMTNNESNVELSELSGTLDLSSAVHQKHLSRWSPLLLYFISLT